MAAIVPGRGQGATLSNGYVIEGVAHITNTSAPATRPDGSALVDGDMWYNPNTGIQATRKGVYWLGRPFINRTWVMNIASTSYSSTAPPPGGLGSGGYALRSGVSDLVYIESLVIDSLVPAPCDGSNFWSCSYGAFVMSNGVGNYQYGSTGLTTTRNTSGAVLNSSVAVNTLFTLTNYTLLSFVFLATKTGSPGNLTANATWKTREIL